MSKAEQGWTPPDDATTLLICDAGGRIKATSSGAAYNGLVGAGHKQMHFAELFGSESKLTKWLSEQMSEARRLPTHSAELCLDESRDCKRAMVVRLESLQSDSEIQEYAIQLFPGGVGGMVCAVGEGDSLVTREQWHDVKNHLGGLKLYATFLKRKLTEGDELRTVEKMLKGIDVLIEHLAKIRRGEAQ